jgi:hypothetical protein
VDSTNVGATKEAGEPLHAGNPGGSSVWFRWTAPVAGPVVFDTLGSTIDTALAVYVGSRVDELTLVLSDDDIDQDGGVYQSRVRFVARAGVEYRIAVDGFSDGAGPAETGSIVLNWTQTSLAPITLTAPLVLGGGSFRCTLAGTPELVRRGQRGEHDRHDAVHGHSHEWNQPAILSRAFEPVEKWRSQPPRPAPAGRWMKAQGVSHFIAPQARAHRQPPAPPRVMGESKGSLRRCRASQSLSLAANSRLATPVALRNIQAGRPGVAC